MSDRVTTSDPRTVLRVTIGLAIWFLLALGVSLSNMLAKAPVPVIGGVLWSLVAIVLAAFWRIHTFRTWLLGLDLRVLVLLHTVRFVGIALLVFHAQGKLPYAFAVPGGWGDIAVAATALVVAFGFMPISSVARWWVVLGWNIFGLIDILYVVFTAIRLGLADRDLMATIIELPLSLLPTFVVPIIIASHVVMGVRLWTWRAERSAGASIAPVMRAQGEN